MSTKRLLCEIYKQLDEKRHEEIRPKPLKRLATLNKPKRTPIIQMPRRNTESEHNTNKKSLRQRIVRVLSRLWDGSWFQYPVIPPGPWNTVYGYRPIPKRYAK